MTRRWLVHVVECIEDRLAAGEHGEALWLVERLVAALAKRTPRQKPEQMQLGTGAPRGREGVPPTGQGPSPDPRHTGARRRSAALGSEKFQAFTGLRPAGVSAAKSQGWVSNTLFVNVLRAQEDGHGD